MGGRGSASGMHNNETQLKGTDKQINWGKEIKQTMQKGISALEDKQAKQRAFAELKNEYEMSGHLKTLNKDIKKAFNKIDSAKWFIDNRNITRNPNWYIDLSRAVIEEKKLFKKK